MSSCTLRSDMQITTVTKYTYVPHKHMWTQYSPSLGLDSSFKLMCLPKIFQDFLNRKFERLLGPGYMHFDLVGFRVSDYAWMSNIWSELSDRRASNQSTCTTVGEQSSVKCLTAGVSFYPRPLPLLALSSSRQFFCSTQARSFARPLACSIVQSLLLEKERKRLLKAIMCLIYFLLDKKCNSILPDQREDCGYYGIGQEECEKVRDCCFDETISNVPWCFKPGGEEPAEESNEGSIESFAWGDSIILL